LGNGLLESTTFNSRLQPIQIAAGSLLTLGYVYTSGSNNGNVASTSIVRPGLSLSQTFSYDATNRLWTAVETGGSSEWSQTYGYDAFGNRAVTAGYIPHSGLTPTAIAQFTNNQWLGSGVSYDAAGNQKTLPSRSFTYDAENRVIAATEPNTAAISYVYDGEGKRVQRTVGASITTYVYDGFGSRRVG
jgi:YD repeat-containing protein